MLIVDDEESDRRILKRHFEKKYPGITIDEATNGVEALWYLRGKYREGNVPDVVVMDVQMPRVDGIEAAKRMRLRGYYVPIYLRTSDPFSLSSSKLGVNRIIDKATSLEKVCRDYLDKHITSQSSE